MYRKYDLLPIGSFIEFGPVVSDLLFLEKMFFK